MTPIPAYKQCLVVIKTDPSNKLKPSVPKELALQLYARQVPRLLLWAPTKRTVKEIGALRRQMGDRKSIPRTGSLPKTLLYSDQRAGALWDCSTLIKQPQLDNITSDYDNSPATGVLDTGIEYWISWQHWTWIFDRPEDTLGFISRRRLIKSTVSSMQE